DGIRDWSVTGVQTCALPIYADPQWMYLTHYGPVGNVQALGRELLEQLAEMVSLGQALVGVPDRSAALREGLAQLYLRRIRAHGCTMSDAEALELLAMDVELNALGM